MANFRDRIDGGKKLAARLLAYKNNKEAIVLGLPRGGVVTAAQVSSALNLPLDIVVPRKIGAPFNPELAVGALTPDGKLYWNEALLKSLHLEPKDLAQTIEKEKKEAERRKSMYRGNRPPLDLKDKIIILVDDGIATGATMIASILSVKARGALKVIAASPVAPVDALEKIAPLVDEFVYVQMPKIFLGISAFYDEFGQTSDEEVVEILRSDAHKQSALT